MAAWLWGEAFLCMVDDSFGLSGIPYTLARFYSLQDLIAAEPPESQCTPEISLGTDKACSLQRSPNSLWFPLLSYYPCLHSTELLEDG